MDTTSHIARRLAPAIYGICLLTGILMAWQVLMGVALGSLR